MAARDLVDVAAEALFRVDYYGPDGPTSAWRSQSNVSRARWRLKAEAVVEALAGYVDGEALDRAKRAAGPADDPIAAAISAFLLDEETAAPTPPPLEGKTE